MIDTVALTLQPDEFQILQPERFTPNAMGILHGTLQLGAGGSTKAVCNPTKADLEAGIYRPRLTLTRRGNRTSGYVNTLRVECSLPKLLYGNNFDELTEADFGQVITTVHERLDETGVRVWGETLRQANVSAIHYGKNIVLGDYVTCGSILAVLAKVSVNGWFDTSKTDYRNDGHGYKLHANNFELMFYDKVRDLEKAQKSPKRTFDNDVAIQQSLFWQPDFDRRQQVLRMEARLGNRQKIRTTLERLKIQAGLTFEQLYRQRIAQAVLRNLWQPFGASIPSIMASAGKTPSALYQQLAQAHPNAKDGQLLKLLAACVLVDDIGWPGVNSLWKGNPRTLARLKQELAALPPVSSVAVAGLQQIGSALNSFEPVQMHQRLLQD
jgi:hypothetical protein